MNIGTSQWETDKWPIFVQFHHFHNMASIHKWQFVKYTPCGNTTLNYVVPRTENDISHIDKASLKIIHWGIRWKNERNRKECKQVSFNVCHLQYCLITSFMNSCLQNKHWNFTTYYSKIKDLSQTLILKICGLFFWHAAWLQAWNVWKVNYQL